MKTVAGIIGSLFLLVVVALLCVNAISAAHGAEAFHSGNELTLKVSDSPKPVFYVQAIKLDGRTGEELDRKNVSGPYDSVDDCSTAQQSTGTQRPEIQPAGLTITVFNCVALQGGQTT